jgi:Zn ribbon nucleic-acid-binding protein
MSSKKPSAGDYIDARCSRCKAITNHTIIAMVEDKVVRVQCNTCGGMHNYRVPKAEKPAKVVKSRTPATPKAVKDARSASAKAAVLDQEQWVAASRDADPTRAVPYSMDGTYKVNSWINHPTFGFGLVLTVVPNKVEILFQDGKKLLRCSS